MLVGLTGGIGSGKSTVAGMLAEFGLEVIDADAIAREVVEPGKPALDAIVDRFGRDVVADDGSLDRAALAAIVFADPVERAALEAVTHPAIRAEIARRYAAATAADPDAVVVVDHPLLIETGQVDDFDALVVVLADRDVRLDRLATHRGMDREDARARMATQASDDERWAVATWAIDNNGDTADLRRRVGAVADEIEAWAGRSA